MARLGGRGTLRAWRPAAGAGLVLAAVIVYRGAFGAWYTGDDFSLLALTRLLDNPLWLFVQNHMLSMPYYRPLGVTVWWLSERAFGHAAGWHYLFNVLLHATVALVLWRLIADLTRREWPGFAAALVFAVHPLAIGTALWLSDRFDLLATLCGLLALRAAWRFRLATDERGPLVTMVWLLLALLSKEIAFVVVPALCVLWWWPSGPASGTRRVRAAAWLLVPVIIVLVARWNALGAFGGGSILAGKSLLPVALRGLGSWFASMPAYFAFPYWMHASDAILAVCAAVALAAWLLLRWRSRLPYVAAARDAASAESTRHAAEMWLAPAIGLCLFLVPAFVQWPMIGAVPVRDVDPAHVLSSVTDSRYYYLSLTGFLMFASGLVALLPRARMRAHRFLPVIAMAALVLAFAATSQRLARKWRLDTTPLRMLVEQANQAIAQLPLPQPTCQIYLLGTRDLILAQYADDIIKATYPDIGRVADCLVQTDRTPWHHLIPVESAAQQQFAPMTALQEHNRKVPWPRVGNVDIAYLNLPDALAPSGMTNAWFLLWSDGRFTDITAEVSSGRMPVDFHCNRPGDQCR